MQSTMFLSKPQCSSACLSLGILAVVIYCYHVQTNACWEKEIMRQGMRLVDSLAESHLHLHGRYLYLCARLPGFQPVLSISM